MFQSSPGPKAGCYSHPRRGQVSPREVSILTRPEGRVLRGTGVLCRARRFCFNPHPARRPGATLSPWRKSRPRNCFNPHPARRPGATGGLAVVVHRLFVSILTRPEGRVLPGGR